MSFRFLPFKQIEENLVGLIAKVYEEHEKTKLEINEKRQAHLDLLDNLFNQLRILTAVVGKEKIAKDIEKSLADLTRKIETQPLDAIQVELKKKLEAVKAMSEEQVAQLKRIREQEAQLELKKKLADLQPMTQEQVLRLKALREAKKPLEDKDDAEFRSLEGLEYDLERKKKVADVKELDEKQVLLKKELVLLEEQNAQKKVLEDIENTVASRKKFEQERTALLKFKDSFEEEAELSDEQKAKALTDEQRSVIVTGVLLNIESEIKLEYSGAVNKLISLVKTNKPENSVLFAGIRPVIGETPDNKLDAKSEKQARDAAAQFVATARLVRQFEPAKLKKTTTAVKEARLVMEDSQNSTLLNPGKSLLEQAKDKALSEKQRDMVKAQIATYTPASETGRYVRDEKSLSSYVQLHQIINPFVEEKGELSREWVEDDKNEQQAVANFRTSMLNHVDRPAEKKLGTVRELNEAEAKVFNDKSSMLKAAIIVAEQKLRDKDYADEKEKLAIEKKLQEDKLAYDQYLQAIKAYVKENKTWNGVKDPSDKEEDNVDYYQHAYQPKVKGLSSNDYDSYVERAETARLAILAADRKLKNGEYKNKEEKALIEKELLENKIIYDDFRKWVIDFEVKSTKVDADTYYKGLRSVGEKYVEKNATLTNEVLFKEKISNMGMFGKVQDDIRKFDKRKLKHVEANETHKIRVQDDIDVHSKPSMRK